jgi:hypothetical protein
MISATAAAKVSEPDQDTLLPQWVVPVVAVLAVVVALLLCALIGVAALLRRARVTSSSEPYVPRSVKQAVANDTNHGNDDISSDDHIENDLGDVMASSSSAKPVPAHRHLDA